MKLDRISLIQAEKLITQGIDKGFSMIKLLDTPYTIYHRIYNNVLYDILQMETFIDDDIGQVKTNTNCVTTFYILDSNEVDIMLKRNRL